MLVLPLLEIGVVIVSPGSDPKVEKAVAVQVRLGGGVHRYRRPAVPAGAGRTAFGLLVLRPAAGVLAQVERAVGEAGVGELLAQLRQGGLEGVAPGLRTA